MGIFEKSEEKVLTKEIAEQFVNTRRGPLRLEEFTILDDGVVDILRVGEGGLGGYLDLSGLSELSDTEIKTLSTFEGRVVANAIGADGCRLEQSRLSGLGLRGLTSLSDAAAESLGRFVGETLNLGGLTSLSDAAAESLGSWMGWAGNSKGEEDDDHMLFLDGITSLSDSAAESLGKFTGHSLNLMRLSEISDEGARGLSKFEGEDFCISTPSSASAAQILRDAGHLYG